MTNLHNELSREQLDTVSGGDNFKGYAEIQVLGLTVTVAETKGGVVEGQVFGGSKPVGPARFGKQ
jgi:hypothetical protein